MPVKIDVIAAALPPQLDGIGDYTAIMSAALARGGAARVRLLTAQANPDPIPGATIETVFSASDPSSVRALLPAVLADPPDWLLVQYNPFSYGPRGFNPYLAGVLRTIKRRVPGLRIATMTHETHVPFTPSDRELTLRFRIMYLWQRPQMKSIAALSDRLWFSIEPWAEDYRHMMPRKQIAHMPIGSALPLSDVGAEEARTRLGIAPDEIVIGLFGTIHVSRMMDWIVRAVKVAREAAAPRPVRVLYVGPHHQVLRDVLPPDTPLIAEGPFPPDEVARRIRAMDIFLSPFIDGVSTRRSSLMAALQHGIAAVGTSAHHTDSILKNADGTALLLADTNDPDVFDEQVRRLVRDDAVRARIGAAARALYESEFAFSRVAERMLDIFNEKRDGNNRE